MKDLFKLQVDMDEIPDKIERTIFNDRQIKIVMTVYIKYGTIDFSAYIKNEYVLLSRSENLDVTLSVLNNELSYIELAINR